jgi:hypothetical protein
VSLAVGLAGALGLIVALLAIPVDLRFHTETEDEVQVAIRVEWLFGRVGRDLQRPPADPGSNSGWLRRVLAVWSDALQEKCLRLLRGLRRATHVQDVRIEGRLGLSDPADTGTAFGILGPLREVLASWPNLDLDLRPDFVEAGWHGQSTGAMRFTPLRAVQPLVAFVASPTVLRAAWDLRARP